MTPLYTFSGTFGVPELVKNLSESFVNTIRVNILSVEKDIEKILKTHFTLFQTHVGSPKLVKF